ncbi:MAG: OmpA family protein, partial [Bacteroidota bacterium]
LEVGLELRRLVSTRNEKYRAKRAKEIEAKKKTAKPIALKNDAQKKALDSVKLLATKNQNPEAINKVDSTTFSKSIVIQRFDSIQRKYEAEAGKVNQEPYLVEKITLRFQFKFNSIDLDDDSEEFLNDLTKTLETDPRLEVKVVGHTDNIGSEKFNERLSLKRAESVQKFLISRGIDPSRVSVKGKGMSQPLTENETEAGRATNRRVEIYLLRK